MRSLYTITNRDSGKIYVGQTKRPVVSRWSSHLNMARNGPKGHLHSAIRKYGAEAFEVVEILQVEDAASASRYEKLLIAIYRSNDPAVGYNLTDGGENCIHNEETRRKISKAKMGNKCALGCKYPPRLLEHSRRISEALTGRKFGPFSAEHRRKIGNALRGRHISESAKVKIGAANRGRKFTEEARKRMSDSRRGTKRTIETRQRMSEARSRWWARKWAVVNCGKQDGLFVR